MAESYYPCCRLRESRKDGRSRFTYLSPPTTSRTTFQVRKTVYLHFKFQTVNAKLPTLKPASYDIATKKLHISITTYRRNERGEFPTFLQSWSTPFAHKLIGENERSSFGDFLINCIESYIISIKHIKIYALNSAENVDYANVILMESRNLCRWGNTFFSLQLWECWLRRGSKVNIEFHYVEKDFSKRSLSHT